MPAELATSVIPAPGSVPAQARRAETPPGASVPDLELFFPLEEAGAAAAAAKAVCASCPLRARCLHTRHRWLVKRCRRVGGVW